MHAGTGTEILQPRRRARRVGIKIVASFGGPPAQSRPYLYTPHLRRLYFLILISFFLPRDGYETQSIVHIPGRSPLHLVRRIQERDECRTHAQGTRTTEAPQPRQG